MKESIRFFFIVLIISAYACSSQGDGSVSIVEVNGGKMAVFSLDNLKSDTATILLSNLVENCSFVQLETNDEAFFKPWFTTVTEKYIGVRNQSGPYKLFSRSGKFLCNIGSRGQGPGEYALTPYDDIIDDRNELVYLAPFMGANILVYNILGQFIKNIAAPERLNKAKLYLSGDVLTVFHMAFGNSRAIAYQFDVNTGQVLNELTPPEHFLVQNFDGEIFNTRNAPGTFDFQHSSSDTLYYFDIENNRINPLFTATYSASEPFKQYCILNEHVILTHVMVLENNSETGRPGFVSKGLVATDLKIKTSSYIKVVNDYYGNMPVAAGISTLRNGYYVYNIQPEQLMDDLKNQLSQSRMTDNDRQTLNQTLSSLQENTNNVVFIGKLRQEFKPEFRDWQ